MKDNDFGLFCLTGIFLCQVWSGCPRISQRSTSSLSELLPFAQAYPVSEMTYTVSSGTLNSTILYYYTIAQAYKKHDPLFNVLVKDNEKQ